MTKFGESEKIELSDFLFQNIRFWQFQGKIKEGAKLQDLKIQGILSHGKGLESIKEPRWMKSKSKAKTTKSDFSVLDTRVSDFPRTDKVLLEFEI
jgi:hypothetical protein